ncbi:MAG: GLUG motif-containing protein [Patescibacteria group bacterium]|nr:GLUG motif-containing protein [Patescibacteria group bacterium]MDD4694991.1 GLUG motif-containing protein [Patescibacteria group bacterium]
MKKINKYNKTSMKKLVFFSLVFLFLIIGVKTSFATADWINVGSAGFSAGRADYTSIAIDTTGTPYVVYMDFGNSNKATVMKYNGSEWVNVGSAGFSAGQADFTSIAIDATGTPYVVYNDSGNSNKATVMKYNGSEWVNVGSAGFSAGQADFTSIAIDTTGTPYVAYRDGENSWKATVMKYSGSAWVNVGSAGFSAGQVYFTSIAIDTTGTPYVVYQNFGYNGKATVMKFDGSDWINVGSADFSTEDARGISIAIDATGTPYVVYQDYGNGSKATVMKYSELYVSSNISDTKITLSWDAISTPNDYTFLGYDIYRNDVKVVSLTSDTEYIDNTIEEEVDYNYYIKAVFEKDAQQLEMSSNNIIFKLYLVDSTDDLNNVRNDLNINSYYLQTSDIDLDVSPYNEGVGWNPIGNNSTKFRGTFDGNNHTISNLFINNADSYGVGLFGFTSSASILKNISLENININVIGGSWAIGGLVGYNYGRIINSHTSGNISTAESSSVIGGLVGESDDTIISNSYSNINVIGGSWAIGGLIGDLWGGIIVNSYATGNVSGTDEAVGGLVGYNDSALIINSYATGDINGDKYIGGLVGDNWGEIQYSYSMGYITGNTDIGGLVGGNHDGGTITSSYYNSQTSGQSDDTGKGTPRTTAEMTYPYDQTSTTTYVGWDFVNTWHSDINGNVNNGYPVNYTYIDSVGPVITILGSNPLSLYKGDSYYDEGATATDAVDGNITSSIVITNNIDINTVGAYNVTYVVSDTAGNTSTSTRVVNVIDRPSSGSTGGGWSNTNTNNNNNQNNNDNENNNNEEQNNNEEDNTNNNEVNKIWKTGKWVKTSDSSTVYFVDTDNIRHSYVNEKIWYSYFNDDFSFVITITKEELATYTLGKNVPYNAGILFKIPTVAKVYLVGSNGTIRWIKTEEKAIELYGKDWNKLVHDLPDELFGDYTEGEVIE